MNYKILHVKEHDKLVVPTADTEGLTGNYVCRFPKKKGKDIDCFLLSEAVEGYQLETSYFIGVDWIVEGEKVITVAPKLNEKATDHAPLEIDFIQMLFSAMIHPDVANQIDELYHIKWDAPSIEIEQKKDVLTPLLVIEYLSVLKLIVQKGLKKSYFPVTTNLNGRIKGKILIAQTVKKNRSRNNQLHTYCSYDEFGINNPENRLLKKALLLLKRYLPLYTEVFSHSAIKNTLHYINPAFETVSSDIELTAIKQLKTNSFYKEYDRALRLAQMIIKRFGYNFSSTGQHKICTPPFWIDMSKLFELYVLGKLKDVYQNKVIYHFKTYGNELDYLINSEDAQMVIDAKYKPKWKTEVIHKDLRQVSGYARLTKTYTKLGKTYPESIDCLIVYPDHLNGLESFENASLKAHPVDRYQGIWKIGIKLPKL